ncbi:MAG: hypothetical protein KJN63_01015 [Acidimicrobiia bacterium]|nr:hypothetical protein [Acidimicrobiia bacterium]
MTSEGQRSFTFGTLAGKPAILLEGLDDKAIDPRRTGVELEGSDISAKRTPPSSSCAWNLGDGEVPLELRWARALVVS